MIDYRDLHPGQWEVAQSDARFRYLVCGRGWGKDYFAIFDTLQALSQDRARRGFYALYVGPSHEQVRKIAWERWKLAVPRKYLAKEPAEKRMELQFRWGPRLQLVGSDRVDSLRGPDIHHLVVTEHAFCRPELWTAIRPGLRTAADRALLITTPNGPNHAWDQWQMVQGDVDWARFSQPTWANPGHDRAGLEEARRTLSRTQFDQEYGAEFEALTGAIYADFSLQRNASQPQHLDPHADIWVGQDFNADLYSAVIAQPRNGGIAIIDEIVTRRTIYDHIEALKAWFDFRRIDWRRRVRVAIDSSGEYNQTTRGASSDAPLLRKAGFKTHADSQNPTVIARIHALQALMLSGTGDVRLWVDPRCKETIKCLLNQTWNQWHKPDKSKGLDHLPDALGYLAWALYPIKPKTFAVAN